MPTWRFDRIAQYLMSEHDLTRAHIAAPHVLEAWLARDAYHWRGVFLSLGIGAIVPLLGYLVLGWPAKLLFVALTLDAVVLWLCEALKGVLAYRRVAEERAHHDEAADVLAVIEGLDRPRLPPNRDLFAATPKARLYRSAVPPREENAMMPWYLLIFGTFFTAMFLLLVVWTVPAAAPWLLAGVAVRIGVSALRTIRANRDSGSRPELLSEASLPTMTLMLSLYPAFVLLSVAKVDLRAYDPRLVSGLVLGLYFVVAASLAWRGWRRVNAVSATLRAFIARDRAQMQARVRQING